MICPACGTDTPAPLDRCFHCSTPFPVTPATISDSDSEAAIAVRRNNPTAPVRPESSLPTMASVRDGVQTTPLMAGGASAISSPSASTLHIGENFGRYRIIKLLGSAAWATSTTRGMRSSARPSR